MFVSLGLVGPKARPFGVVEGQAVEILLLGKVSQRLKGMTEMEESGFK